MARCFFFNLVFSRALLLVNPIVCLPLNPLKYILIRFNCVYPFELFVLFFLCPYFIPKFFFFFFATGCWFFLVHSWPISLENFLSCFVWIAWHLFRLPSFANIYFLLFYCQICLLLFRLVFSSYFWCLNPNTLIASSYTVFL